MTEDMNRVLVVDDSPEDIQFIIEALKNDYNVLVATSGAKALEMALREPKPDVILLDVNMPDMDGYETCRQLKQDSACRDIDVIFVSAHDTTEEKLKGYEVGAADYIIKPVDPVEIRQKVALAIANNTLNKDLEQEKNAAMKMAMTAITSTGELGVVLEFLKESYSVKDNAALAALISNVMLKYSLETVCYVRSPVSPCIHSSKMPVSPLETELLSRLTEKDRIVSHGNRLILNYGNVALLIKNMPLDDSDLCGRLRDNLAILLEGAAARQETIDLALLDASRQNQIQELIKSSNEALEVVAKEQQELKDNGMRIMDGVLNKIDSTFISLGLSEDQEDDILKIIQGGVEEMSKNMDRSVEVDRQMNRIVDGLKCFSNK
jgi:CheY-like chemotaxis protein